MIELYKNEMFPPRGQGQTDFTLFIGSPSCFYHNCGMMRSTGNVAAFCPTDVQMSLGLVEDAVVEAVGEVLAEHPDVRSIILFTSCQAGFYGMDLDALARSVRREHNILCVHRENCRILERERGANKRPPAPPWERDDGTMDQLLDAMPPNPIVPGCGLLVLNGGAPLEEGNELFDAARQWGFDWVQCSAEWRSLDALAMARSSELVIVIDDRQLQLAQSMEERWHIPYFYLPDSCRIEEVDGYYNAIGDFVGAHADLSAARFAAGQAVNALACVAWGTSFELAGPASALPLLEELCASVQLAEQMPPMGFGPRPGGPGGPGAGRPLFRSGNEHFPTAGGAMRRGRPGGPLGARETSLPARSSLWGYRAVEDFATRLAWELM